MEKQDINSLEEKYINNVQANDRVNIIDEILLQYIKDSAVQPNKERKISFFIGGGSNSGKSTFRENLTSIYNDLLIIDADKMKEKIPEYQDLIIADSQVAASIVHRESSQMASKLLTKAIEKEISTTFDGTLKNTEKYVGFFKMLRQAGFSISLTIIDVPVEIALVRNRLRYDKAVEENKFPRLVPDEDVIESHSMIAKSFVALKDLVDEWTVIDTQDVEDQVIAEGKKGIENILHEKKFQQFLKK